MDSSTESDPESFEEVSNSDEEYVPIAPLKKQESEIEVEEAEPVNPLRAMLNKAMARSEGGRRILEEEKQKKEAERLAKIPVEPEKPPSPKFKTVKKLRSTFPVQALKSRKKSAYTGIGNDTYHTFDRFTVRIPDKPSAEEVKR